MDFFQEKSDLLNKGQTRAVVFQKSIKKGPLIR